MDFTANSSLFKQIILAFKGTIWRLLSCGITVILQKFDTRSGYFPC